MPERIQKLIAASGLMSRRSAEACIAAGRVSVNGRPAAPGESADPEKDTILLDGRPLRGKSPAVYLMLNKPRGYLTTLHDEKGRRDLRQLLKGVEPRVFPVGRLDADSEGLLFLTNDGDFANRMMHPSHEVEKIYHTWVRGECTPEKLERLRQPMVLDGVRLRPARTEMIRSLDGGALLSVTIHEGRNRQVRRMCEAVGLQVTRLRRVSEGGVELGDLKPGCIRALTADEIEKLRG